MTKFRVEATYTFGATLDVELPEGLTWEDVKDWYVKWDTLHLLLKDGRELNYDFNTECFFAAGFVDWKRPVYSAVYEEDSFDPFDEHSYLSRALKEV
jgi:hypothetical protein